MIYFLSVLVLGLIVAVGICVKRIKEDDKKYDDMVAHKNDLIALCEEDLKEIRQDFEQTKMDLINANTSLTRVRDELHQERLARKNDQVEIEKLRVQIVQINSDKSLEEQQISSAEKEYEILQSRISDLNERLEFRTQEISDSEKYYSALVKSIEEMHDEKSNMMESISDLQAQLEELGLAKVNLFEAVENLKRTNNLAIKHQLKDEEENECGWAFEVTPHEAKLIALIDELKALAPQLSADLSGIVWKRIWLPKIQELCNREDLGSKRGIYVLSVKENRNCKYIGQAVNIKERWYQHMKKMLGVDNKGAEKLYEYRPEELIWGIVEEVGADENMDERERYWIEFFAAKAGLNKR